MEALILKLFYFLRPSSYINVGVKVGGFNLLEIFAIIFFIFLFFIYLLQITSKNRFKFELIDGVIYLYILWCVGAFLAYIDKSTIKDVAKFLIPFFTFIVIRNSLTSREQYIKLLKILIIGFSIPITITAVLIVAKKGIWVQDYWTGLYRFTGIYPNPHDLGHNMTFFLMLNVVYYILSRDVTPPPATEDGITAQRGQRKSLINIRRLFITAIIALALYCLYKSYVRTAYLGLLVFFFCFLFFYKKKLLLIFGSVFVAGILVSLPLWSKIFHDVVAVYEGKRATERIASGRPYIWQHNLSEFAELSFDRKLAGVGIGNRYQVLRTGQGDNIWNSHNDFLEVMMQTGIVGFILFMILQVLIFKQILALDKRDRPVFLALFLAVSFMNFASNSYVVRFGLGQMLYMLLAGISTLQTRK